MSAQLFLTLTLISTGSNITNLHQNKDFFISESQVQTPGPQIPPQFKLFILSPPQSALSSPNQSIRVFVSDRFVSEPPVSVRVSLRGHLGSQGLVSW